MGLLDRQRESIIAATNEREGTQRDRMLRDDRNRIRNASEIRDRSYKFRPEYGWRMNDAGLLAEQERKGQYDTAVDDYTGAIGGMRDTMNASITTGRNDINKAYDDAASEIRGQHSSAMNQSKSIYGDAINTVNAGPGMTSTEVGGRNYDVVDPEHFTDWATIPGTQESQRYPSESSTGSGGGRFPSGGDDRSAQPDNVPMEMTTRKNSVLNLYVDSQNSQITQTREANLSALLAEQSVTNKMLDAQLNTALGHNEGQRTSSLSDYDGQSAAIVKDNEAFWKEELEKLSGAYDESVTEGAKRYQDYKDYRSDSITGASSSNATGATAEEISTWGADAVNLSESEINTQIKKAEENNDTGLVDYLMGIINSRRTKENNAKEKI